MGQNINFGFGFCINFSCVFFTEHWCL